MRDGRIEGRTEIRRGGTEGGIGERLENQNKGRVKEGV